MKLREGIAWVLVLAAFAVGGAVWQRARELENRLAEAQAEAARMKALEAQAASAERDLAAARAAKDLLRADLDKEVASRKAAEAKDAELAGKLKSLEASAKPAPAPKGPKKNALKAMMAMSAKAMHDPALRKQMLQGTAMQVGMMYGDLLKEWGLEGEARQAIVDLLAERLLAESECKMLLMDEELSSEEVIRRQEESMEKQQKALADKLDAGRLARLEAFDGEIPDRLLGQQVDQGLSALNLDQGQRERVRAVLMDEARGASVQVRGNVGGLDAMPHPGRRMTAEDVARARQVLSGEGSGMEDTLKALETSHQSSLERVRPLLTQEQFETFRKQQESQMQVMRMSLEMLGASGGKD